MNWKDKTIFIGDNLHIMRGMNSDSVDLIYLDPLIRLKHHHADLIGSQATGTVCENTWPLNKAVIAEYGELAEQSPSLTTVIQAAREAHGRGMQIYLIMMSVRLLEIKRILKDTGSIYLHCDSTDSHYLKLGSVDIWASRYESRPTSCTCRPAGALRYDGSTLLYTCRTSGAIDIA